jgi:hypothetical protein
MKNILFWAPRLLSIAFAGFLAVFALDVFEETGPLAPLMVSFVVHLVPAILVLIVVGILWHRDSLASAIFAAGGLYYAVANLRHPSWVYAISGPLILISILFLMNWRSGSQLSHAS